MKLKYALIAAAFVVGAIAFQNCSQVSFVQSPTATDEYVNGIPTNIAPDGTPVDIGKVPEFKCKTFTEITASSSQIFDIPGRNTSGECFYVKLISAAKFEKSNSNPRKDNDVISRSHDAGVSDSTKTHSPYLLGSRSVRMILRGERLVKLSGGKNDSTRILVDNFIMVGISPSSQSGDPAFYKAYGTSDSTVNNSNNVLFKTKPVAVKAFGTGGTSTISALSLDGSIEIGRDTTLDARALDCGAYGETTDIYLLFQ